MNDAIKEFNEWKNTLEDTYYEYHLSNIVNNDLFSVLNKLVKVLPDAKSESDVYNFEHIVFNNKYLNEAYQKIGPECIKKIKKEIYQKQQEFISSFPNPLDDNKVLDFITDSYCKKGDFYDNIVNCDSKDTNNEQINEEDKKKFFIYFVNKFASSYSDDPISNYEDAVKRWDECKNYVIRHNLDLNLDLDNEGFHHIKSSSYNPDGVKHRIYININKKYLYKFINIFIDKCNYYVNGLPYYFKYDEACNRSDSFVLYLNNYDFFDYFNILNEIGKEYPEMVNTFGKPPVLSSKISSWYGYGSEPTNYDSFNEIRCKHILYSFAEYGINLIKNNKEYENEAKVKLNEIISNDNFIRQYCKSNNFYDTLKEVASYSSKYTREIFSNIIAEEIQKNPNAKEEILSYMNKYAELFNISDSNYAFDSKVLTKFKEIHNNGLVSESKEKNQEKINLIFDWLIKHYNDNNYEIIYNKIYSILAKKIIYGLEKSYFKAKQEVRLKNIDLKHKLISDINNNVSDITMKDIRSGNVRHYHTQEIKGGIDSDINKALLIKYLKNNFIDIINYLKYSNNDYTFKFSSCECNDEYDIPMDNTCTIKKSMFLGEILATLNFMDDEFLNKDSELELAYSKHR